MSSTSILPPQFEPGSIESRLYGRWLESGVFAAKPDPARKPYTIMLPPPNVTGVLHIGHAMCFTLQDVLIRFKRMQGFNTLWMPGVDHAGIATQAVVERKIFEEEHRTRESLGREEFLRRVWAWKDEHGDEIVRQLKEMGYACDWGRTRFTLDDGLSQAVLESFVRMYNAGLIYRGARIVNWDCTLGTAVSDDEIEMVPERGILAFIKYPIRSQPGKYIEVATTRPETMFGDTGIAVHPEDERYLDVIGESVMLPLVNRPIPVIADASVDPKFGTGAVKITPGHDPADFERGQRANLPTVIVFNRDGTLNEHCGEYAGTQRAVARKRVLADLEAQGLLSRVEEHEHNVPQSDRSKTIIEPMVSEQWFVRMGELVKPALAAFESGELSFVPARWGKIYAHWLHNVKDWCISRQLWWGHRIPVYYDEDDTPVAAITPPTHHPQTGKPIVRQDDDVLDTWFSSALWPLSTLGWPKTNEDLEYFYPTNTLVTAPEILYLWVARMVIQGYQFVGKKPFSHVFLNPTVQDEHGKRMSKSIGNGIDPVAMIRLYGVDSLRFSLVDMTTDKQDCKLLIEREPAPKGKKYGRATGVKQFENARNFVNKVWNASRFALSNLGDFEPTIAQLSADQQAKVRALNVDAIEDRWILSRLHSTIDSVTRSLEGFRFHDATQAIYHFIWDDFCDWYLEVIKPRFYEGKGGLFSKGLAQATLVRVLDSTLRLLHPIAPFVSEELWLHSHAALGVLEDAEPASCLMLEAWPVPQAARMDAALEAEFGRLQDLIRGVRNIRAEHNIPRKREVPLILSFADASSMEALDPWTLDIIKKSVGAASVELGVGCARPVHAGSVVCGPIEAFVPLADLIDVEMERKRQIAQAEKLKARIHGLKQKLRNPSYVDNAPPAVVQQSREMLEHDVQELSRIEASIEAMMKSDA